MIDYILCYGVSFCSGMLTMGIILYLIVQDRDRKRMKLEKRIKQLRRDNRCRATTT
jgi:hypothetical protein